MPNPHNDNPHSLTIYTINHSVVAHANTKMVSLRF
jgi:hypothetical protein